MRNFNKSFVLSVSGRLMKTYNLIEYPDIFFLNSFIVTAINCIQSIVKDKQLLLVLVGYFQKKSKGSVP